MGYIGSDPKTNESVSTAQLVDDSVTNAKIVDNVLFNSVTSSIVSASGTVTADTFTGTFSGALSSSAQIASNISGSLGANATVIRSLNRTTISGSLGSNAAIIRSLNRTTISGSIPQSLGTSDSPTFAGATITGTLTAQEIHTEFESASVIFTSGSTIFGNSSDDVHNMTGSLNISGSLFVKDGTLTVTDNVDFNGDLDVDGTTNLDVVDIDGNVTIGNTVVNPASGFSDQTGIGLKHSATVPEVNISSDAAGLQVGRTSTGGTGKIAEFRKASNVVFDIDTAGSVSGSATSTGSFGHIKLGIQGNIDLSSDDVIIRNLISNKDLIFKGNDGGTEVETMRINYSGNNVGIGTSGIGAKLHVDDDRSTAYNGAAEIAETVIFRNKNGSDDSGVNNVVSIGLQVADGATSQGFINYVRTGNNTGEFTFSQRTAGSTYAEHMRITSDGKVGIGHTTPQYGLTMAQGNADGQKIGWEDGGNTKRGAILVNSDNDSMEFMTGASDTVRIRIDSVGNTTIGAFSMTNPHASYNQFNVGGFGVMHREAYDAYITSNCYYNTSGQFIAKYAYSGGIAAMYLLGGDTTFNTYNGSVSAGSNYTLSERMRIKSDGALTLVEKTNAIANSLRFQGLETVGDDEAQNYTMDGTCCIVILANHSSDDAALFFMSYASATITKIADPSNEYDTSATDGKSCIYKNSNSATFTIENKRGGARNMGVAQIAVTSTV